MGVIFKIMRGAERLSWFPAGPPGAGGGLPARCGCTYVLSWLSLPPSGVAYPLDGTPDGTPDAEAAVRSADLTSLFWRLAVYMYLNLVFG